MFFILRRLTRGYCEGCGKNEAGVGWCLQSRACHGFLHSIPQNFWKASINTHHCVLYKGAPTDVMFLLVTVDVPTYILRTDDLVQYCYSFWFRTSLAEVTISIVSWCKLSFCVILALTWSSSFPTRTSSDSYVHSMMSMWDRSIIPQSPPLLQVNPHPQRIMLVWDRSTIL